MKLSIILPIYNVEKFLGACLESLYAQDISTEEYEIICVIDGSPDDSKQVVEGYMKKYSNIQLLIQENKGVCAARNVGLRNANGKYIWFIDPDDIIATNCLGKIICEMEKSEADVFEMQYKTCEEEHPFTREIIEFQVDGANKKGSSGSACLSVCSKDYLEENKIVFNESLSYGEDYLWAFQTKYRKHKSIYTDSALYVYRQRNNSAMNVQSEAKIKKHMDDMICLYYLYIDESERCKKDKMDKWILKNIEQRKRQCVEAALICLFRLRLTTKEVKEQLKMLQEKQLYPYHFMFENLFGKERHSLKVRLFTFLFPIKAYFLLVCFLNRKAKK